MTEVLRAREILEDLGVATDVWSVTSYYELSREALRVERQALLNQTAERPVAYVRRLLDGEQGVFVAASDYMKLCR